MSNQICEKCGEGPVYKESGITAYAKESDAHKTETYQLIPELCVCSDCFETLHVNLTATLFNWRHDKEE